VIEPEEGSPAPSSPGSKLAVHLMIGGVVVLVLIGAYQVIAGRSRNDLSIGVADHRATAVRDSRKAPGFTLPDLASGRSVSLSDFRGRIVVLNVWASWCLPCREEAPGLQATWQAYRSRGVQFLGSDYADDRYAARAFIDEFGITYPSVFDPSGELAADYGFFGLPSTFVIDGSQRIRVRFTGYVTARDLREILDEFLAKAPG
jgi:cytochrome c biogenesis protein CcmG, thiol:disulfide interchange protein DsbE